MIPPGFIPAASVKRAPGKSNDVKTPWLSRKAWLTPAVSVYSPTMSPSGLPAPANVNVAPGKSIVVNVVCFRQACVTTAISTGGPQVALMSEFDWEPQLGRLLLSANHRCGRSCRGQVFPERRPTERLCTCL